MFIYLHIYLIIVVISIITNLMIIIIIIFTPLIITLLPCLPATYALGITTEKRLHGHTEHKHLRNDTMDDLIRANIIVITLYMIYVSMTMLFKMFLGDDFFLFVFCIRVFRTLMTGSITIQTLLLPSESPKVKHFITNTNADKNINSINVFVLFLILLVIIILIEERPRNNNNNNIHERQQ